MSVAVNPKVFEWLESRGISGETAVRMGIFSGHHRPGGDDGGFRVEPHSQGSVIAFPFLDRGEVVAEKYRAAGKRFYQRPGGRKTFYNADILDDPALTNSTAALVITEGEMDCLSAIEAGYPFVVSVPDGAPPARDKDGNLIDVPETADDIDPKEDDKFRFLANAWPRLQSVKRIIIATDNDEPGMRLAAELVRRLGRVRCSFVTYPDGCKDLNDVLMQHGSAEVNRLIVQAKPYPVSGLYKLSEFPAEPPLRPASTGWPDLDRNLLVYHPALMVVTGFANAGKSTWANQLVAQLAWKHGWRCAIASFEMRVKPFVTDMLAASYVQQPKPWTTGDIAESNRWLEESFLFIAPDPEREEDTDLAWLIEKAEAAVIRHGIRVLLIDPWNELEHNRKKDETVTDYTGRALRALKLFARRFDCLVIIVAHPSKGAVNKKPDELSLYDIADTANFANKADLGVIVARRGEATSVYVRKVRYQPETGLPGEVVMVFDRKLRLFREPVGNVEYEDAQGVA
ncbi:toprim domain-containing protein [Methylobacterium sp. E-065]|uniref:DnaB-like helicase C-terminal domain-containing protein n=1 Tax=Methylobacterium sp. E-065 TaxID=2836583 RepID=UPI001FB959A7|nr:DnaB-like helicase C-terminal domain-containing protein [Methylobacterium sp. E-065]MCJ2019447.1 toprim domain-containing protein [Methylobacterium sp. E-065]